MDDGALREQILSGVDTSDFSNEDLARLVSNVEGLMSATSRSAARSTQDTDVVLVAAHGNSLRAILKELDGISDEDIPSVNIDTGVPYLYEMTDGTPTGKRILEA